MNEVVLVVSSGVAAWFGMLIWAKTHFKNHIANWMFLAFGVSVAGVVTGIVGL